jgi:hypothetical protein
MFTKSFRVKSAKLEDVYKDIVRIPETQRCCGTTGVIPEGTLCRITSGKNQGHFGGK